MLIYLDMWNILISLSIDIENALKNEYGGIVWPFASFIYSVNLDFVVMYSLCDVRISLFLSTKSWGLCVAF